jgi:putative tricarboxylic transport membrane protein
MSTTNISRRTALAAILSTVAGGVLTNSAWAKSSYPDKNITMIVPFGAGGGSDILARTIASVIQDLKLLPVELLVENRPGSSGAKGYKAVADRKGDPYFIATVSVSFFTTPLLGASPVSLKNFTPIAAIAMSPYILVAKSDSGIKSLADVAKAKRLTTGSVGVVSDAALITQMMNNEMKSNIDVVPFNGEGEITSGVLGGHLDLMLGNPGEVLPQIEAGTLRPLAVTTAGRLKSLPNVPSFKEAGYNIEHAQLRAIVMPLGVSAEVVAYWENILRKVAESDAWKTKYLDRFKDEPKFAGHTEVAALMQETNERYATLMKQLKIIK